MNLAPRFPCAFGECTKTGRDRTSTWVQGPNRTIESLLTNNEQWIKETGGDRDKLKQFFNSEFPPLITSVADPSPTQPAAPTLVLHRVPPPLLHTVLLNPTNHLLVHLGGVWPGLHDFLKGIHVVKDNFFGGKFQGVIPFYVVPRSSLKLVLFTTTFSPGPECRKIYRNLSQLETLLPEIHKPYLTALTALHNLNKMCNLVIISSALPTCSPCFASLVSTLRN